MPPSRQPNCVHGIARLAILAGFNSSSSSSVCFHFQDETIGANQADLTCTATSFAPAPASFAAFSSPVTRAADDERQYMFERPYLQAILETYTDGYEDAMRSLLLHNDQETARMDAVIKYHCVSTQDESCLMLSMSAQHTHSFHPLYDQGANVHLQGLFLMTRRKSGWHR